MKRFDWDYWRKEYLTSDATLDDLSRREDAPSFIALRKRSGQENWPRQRQEFRNQVKNTAARVPPEMIEEAQRLIDSTNELIDRAEVIARHSGIAKGILVKSLQALKNLDPQQLSPRDIIAFLKLGFDTERLCIGLETNNTKLNIDLSSLSDEELEKLEKELSGDG